MRSTAPPGPRLPEFVALIALQFSLVALAIDAMLPALPDIAADLGVRRENDRQLVVSMLFVGLAAGQAIYGPLSDSIGRKPAIYAGLALFVIGCAVSMLAVRFEWMLLGRVLQGIGAAGPRIVTVAMVRDQHSGAAMARVMSIAMACFILVPAIAPAIGQGILLLAPWPAIFAVFAAIAALSFAWLWLRQPETLPAARRVPLAAATVARNVRHALSNRICFGYTLATAALFSAFMGYLNSAQQIFQDLYGLGAAFPLYFGILALSIGAAAIVNSALVMRLGMHRLTRTALITMIVLAAGFVPVVLASSGRPPLGATMTVLLACFFCFGILFGNLNALALEPMGRLAGAAASVVGAVSTGLSIPLGIAIGRAYDSSVLPLVAGIALLAGAALLATMWARSSPAAS